MNNPALLLAAVAMLWTDGALGSSSAWFEMEGARMRLVTARPPEPGGKLRGALEIELKPGWKTYWRDPGDAGVPPSIDVSGSRNVSGAEIEFPPPRRHFEGDQSFAGYDGPVALPVAFTMQSPGAPAAIEAQVFLGVCRDICVPARATLALDPEWGPDDAGDAAIVAAAWASLPRPASADFGVTLIGADDGTIVLEASAPGDPETAELFLAAEEGYAFRAPERTTRSGKARFSIRAEVPAVKPSGAGLHYTLVTDAGAVSGRLPYF